MRLANSPIAMLTDKPSLSCIAKRTAAACSQAFPTMGRTIIPMKCRLKCACARKNHTSLTETNTIGHESFFQIIARIQLNTAFVKKLLPVFRKQLLSLIKGTMTSLDILSGARTVLTSDCSVDKAITVSQNRLSKIVLGNFAACWLWYHVHSFKIITTYIRETIGSCDGSCTVSQTHSLLLGRRGAVILMAIDLASISN